AQDASPAAGAAPAALPAGCSVYASGLANPRHLTIGEGGMVYVALAGSAGDTPIYATPAPGTPAATEATSMTGDTGAVDAINTDGTVSTVASGFPSLSFGTEVVGPAGVAATGTTLYVVTGGAGPATPAVDPMQGRAAVWSVDVNTGETKVVADLEAFERTNNPDPHNIDSNPYAITIGSDGMLYVADAGGNDILKVDPTSGEVSLLAVIPGLPGQQANPERGGALELDPVPTGLAWAPDGGLYVSLLSGGPFIPGTSQLLHVAMDGTVTTVASGLTMQGDVTVAPDGSIYVVTMSDNFIDAAGPAPGSIVKVNADGTSTPVITGLPFPGSIAFDADGNAYITAMVSLPVGTPAGGMVLKCEASAFQTVEATPAG
ncbi:MAG: ScyD/ScyE family protein, partial [Thermomicrobiales bacterium]|nr:ScyD/ScyE family protein [Thermomicrobiales bacterium]